MRIGENIQDNLSRHSMRGRDTLNQSKKSIWPPTMKNLKNINHTVREKIEAFNTI